MVILPELVEDFPLDMIVLATCTLRNETMPPSRSISLAAEFAVEVTVFWPTSAADELVMPLTDTRAASGAGTGTGDFGGVGVDDDEGR